MKLHALMIAAALAVAGTAFAQAPNGTDKAPADTTASMPSGHTAKAHKKHVAKAKHHVKHRASAMRHHEEHQARAHMRHHEMHARAHMEHDTRAMGAGPSSASTNLDSSARQHRMDLAYNDWLRKQNRR